MSEKAKDKKGSPLQWRTDPSPDGHVHVMPNDGRHIESSECWCEPELKEDYTHDGGKQLWVHRQIQ